MVFAKAVHDLEMARGTLTVSVQNRLREAAAAWSATNRSIIAAWSAGKFGMYEWHEQKTSP